MSLEGTSERAACLLREQMGMNFSRPFGTWSTRTLFPTLKRWAIVVRSLRDGTPDRYPIGYNHAAVIPVKRETDGNRFSLFHYRISRKYFLPHISSAFRSWKLTSVNWSLARSHFQFGES